MNMNTLSAVLFAIIGATLINSISVAFCIFKSLGPNDLREECQS